MAGVKDIWTSSIALMRGMSVTLTNFLRRPVTVQYPEERHELPPGYRGIPSLNEEEPGGKLKCTGCSICARSCPIHIITVTSKTGDDGKKTVDDYSIDMSRCMLCGLCVESCPFSALEMYDHFELASPDKSSLVYGKDRLRRSNLEQEKAVADRRLARYGQKRSRLPSAGTSYTNSRS